MAAGRNLTAKFILTLRDGVSAGLGALRRRLDGLASAGRRIGAIGAGIAAISFAGPIASAAAFQDMLLQTQITAGGIGTAALTSAAEAGRAYERLALETGQRSRDLAAAAQNLVAAGLSRSDVAAFMPILARTATATGASLEDLSRTTVALRQNLGITSADVLAGSLASMATAGKAGMFELRDMAREFPQLTAAAQSLGLTGRTAVDSLSAMLQVARQGAGSSSEAANNLANFLQKLTSPETVKNFRELGVNLQGVLADAARRGINPIEAVIQKIRERTGGDMFRIGSLFGDRQVLDFLRPMLRGTQEYLDILENARNANASLIDQDFATRMLGAQMSLNLVMERGEQILRRIGLGAASSLGPVNEFLKTVQDGMAWMDAAYPGLLDQTIGWVAGIAALAGILGVLVPIVGFLLAGLRLLIVPLRLVLGPLRLVMVALMAIGAPLGIAAAAAAALGTALVAAGLHIWTNWSRFSVWFEQMWAGIRAVLAGISEYVMGLFTADTARSVAGLKQIWEGLGTFFSGLWSVIRALFVDFAAWVDSWTGGAMTGLVNGILAGWRPVMEFFRDLFAIISSVSAVRETSTNSAMAPDAQTERRQRFGNRAGLGGFYAPEAANGSAIAPRAAPEMRGRIVIETTPGTTVREAETNQPGLTFEPMTGRVLGRP